MANSITDVFTAIQNGVTALNNFGKQMQGSLLNISTQLTTLNAEVTAISSAGIVTSIAGNIGAFTLSSATGITHTVNDIELFQASSSQFGAVKVDGTTIVASSGVLSFSPTGFSPIKAALTANVAMNNSALFFDGPTIAQGSSGTWLVTGSVTIIDNSGAANINCKLWDGTNIIASGTSNLPGASAAEVMSLSGIITSPSSNLKISCKDLTTTGGLIEGSSIGLNLSVISAIRIA